VCELSFRLLVARLVSADSQEREEKELVVESVGRLGCWSEGLWGIGRCCLESRLRGRERGGVRFLPAE
jgi:hypothetical protein